MHLIIYFQVYSCIYIGLQTSTTNTYSLYKLAKVTWTVLVNSTMNIKSEQVLYNNNE